MNELITKSQQTADLLCADLREASSIANQKENRAEHILLRNLLADAIKIMQTLNELQ